MEVLLSLLFYQVSFSGGRRPACLGNLSPPEEIDDAQQNDDAEQ